MKVQYTLNKAFKQKPTDYKVHTAQLTEMLQPEAFRNLTLYFFPRSSGSLFANSVFSENSQNTNIINNMINYYY